MGTSGTSTRPRTAARHSRHAFVRIPCASAFSAARRITGPSASGSENGKAELDEIGATVDRGFRQLGRLGAGHQIDDEGLGHGAFAHACEGLGEVLVAAAREADDDQLRVEVVDPGQRVRRLERRDDPLGACEPPEGLERLVVGGAT